MRLYTDLHTNLETALMANQAGSWGAVLTSVRCLG